MEKRPPFLVGKRLLVNDRVVAFCDVRFFAVFETRRLPSFWSSFSSPLFFPVPAGMISRLWTRLSPPVWFLSVNSMSKRRRRVLRNYFLMAEKERSTAAIVSVKSASVWAVVINQASYLDGARQIPSSSIRRKNWANSSLSAF